jgi:hypothetical protein
MSLLSIQKELDFYTLHCCIVGVALGSYLFFFDKELTSKSFCRRYAILFIINFSIFIAIYLLFFFINNNKSSVNCPLQKPLKVEEISCRFMNLFNLFSSVRAIIVHISINTGIYFMVITVITFILTFLTNVKAIKYKS